MVTDAAVICTVFGAFLGFCGGMFAADWIGCNGLAQHQEVTRIWRGRAEAAEAKLKKIKEQFDGE